MNKTNLAVAFAALAAAALLSACGDKTTPSTPQTPAPSVTSSFSSSDPGEDESSSPTRGAKTGPGTGAKTGSAPAGKVVFPGDTCTTEGEKAKTKLGADVVCKKSPFEDKLQWTLF